MAEWYLGSGEEVFDREPSHIHAGVTPELLSESLAQVWPDEVRVKRTVDFGHIIGASNCVKTREEDEIIYAQRLHRPGLSRFVKNRKPEPTSLLTLTVRRMPEGWYELRTAYIGGPGCVEPWAAQERLQEAIEFWGSHALVWGSEPTIPGTETTACPW
ncbi:MAG: hypothetical protein HY549_13530 [Elusimicrobia bacterium]|nr:hypothetical protein [Elusimicrobiota bacterium]